MSALLIAPHNDDETLFASFLCLRYRPHVIVCLRSFRMGASSYPHSKFSMTYAKREEETDQAMRVLGCSWEQWEIPDNGKEADIGTSLALQMDSLRDGWDAVFAPAVEENGQFQHNLVGEMAGRVFGGKVVSYLTYTPAGRSRDGEEVPYEPNWPAFKLRALACYESQIRHPSTRAHFIDGGLREYVVRP